MITILEVMRDNTRFLSLSNRSSLILVGKRDNMGPDWCDGRKNSILLIWGGDVYYF
jgi:hypothetical protein